MIHLQKQLEATNYRFQHMSVSEWFKVFPDAEPYLKNKLSALEAKEEKLEARITQQMTIIDSRIKKLKKLGATGARVKDYGAFWFSVVRAFKGEDLNATSKAIRDIKWAVEPPKAFNDSQITPQMIERAKNFPIYNLFEKVSRDHFVNCPFHNETKPSAYLKNNYFYCFGCNIHEDTIGILMKRDGLEFPEAVRKLLT